MRVLLLGPAPATFASLMIPHHEGAVTMGEAARERGQHEEIRTLAANIIEAQRREIAILEPHALRPTIRAETPGSAAH